MTVTRSPQLCRSATPASIRALSAGPAGDIIATWLTVFGNMLSIMKSYFRVRQIQIEKLIHDDFRQDVSGD
jgi:hypothetical protein